jgi:hypothetical protein
LIGGTSSFAISWGSGDFSVGLAKAKASPPGEATIRLNLVISQGGGKYAPTNASEKTKLAGKVAFSAADPYNCADDSDPISSLNLSLPTGASLIASRT